jgi:Uma2 family endonuclease
MPATVPQPKFEYRTLEDVQARVGHVPPARILNRPPAGTATVLDLLDPTITHGRRVELVNGILLEKPMGFDEDYLAAWILRLLGQYLDANNIGALCGSQGLIRLGDNLVRLPDVSFIRWDSVDDPDEIENPDTAFLEVPPDLVVEVLSERNTPREMAIKLGEYARAGVQLVWYVDPDAKTVTVYPKGRERGRKVLTEADTLDGGKVLPGFTLAVKAIFARRAPARKPKKGKK